MERSEQLTLEVGRWSASVLSIAATIVFVLVVGMLAKSTWANNARAEDWRQRAIAAEEAAGGMRVVLADRSRALNERTRQANALISTLASSRGALRETKSSVGALARQRRQLAGEYARAETARRKLAAQRAALASVAATLGACSRGLAGIVNEAQRGKPKAVLATAGPQLTRCNRARTRLNAVLEQG